MCFIGVFAALAVVIGVCMYGNIGESYSTYVTSQGRVLYGFYWHE